MKLVMHTLALICVMSVSALAQEPLKPGKEHGFLAEVEGDWVVKMHSQGGDVLGSCTYKMAHNGLWLTSTLAIKMPEGPFTGQGLDSYDPVKKKYVAIWVDSMSASPMMLEGDRSQDGKKMTMSGKGPGPDGKPTVYNTETEYINKDKHTFKMWMGPVTGEPMFVATYERKK